MASITNLLQSRPIPARSACFRPSCARRSVLAAAGSSRQDKKAEYVKKQDEADKKNPGGSAGGGQTRDKKAPTGAYGSTGKDYGPGADDGKADAFDRGQDATKEGAAAQVFPDSDEPTAGQKWN